ncbi:MAG TPA: tetratricopeptide repeat protein [Chthoniobacteraceae bacterium]|jgi:tetratricopeptide (TPR) repeat protein|nr:Tetratricopeptide domain protein [Chthoniobacter sp.]HEV7869575.1 tetratricopeptide repeat protein [Chthoniobacteraceae bacterium]
MPIQTDKDLPENARTLWLKALSAVELRNYGYAISLIQAVLKEAPAFLEGRKRLRKVEITATKGKKSFLSGLSTASMKGGSAVKKDPMAAMELAEKTLETDPTNTAANHLLKDAAKAAGHPEIAAFALETLVDANPTDTKLMHELGEHYLSMGSADKAVEVYSKIAAANPSDMVALKRSKDAAATASMKSGGWETAKDYRDLIKNKDEAVSLEQKGRVVKDADMIDTQLGELYAEWEQNQTSADLSRRIARLYEDKHEIQPNAETLANAIWYYDHANTIVNGSDPAVARRLSDLQFKQVELQFKDQQDYITQTEAWLAGDGADHEDAETYRQALEEGRKRLEELTQERAALQISDAKKRVDRNPTDLQLRFEYGEKLLEAGQFNEAIPELQKARQNPNTRLRAMSLLGRCFVQKGMFDMAAVQFKSAASEMVAMDTVKKDTLYDLGLVYEKMGRKEEYLQCMKDIMETDYGYKDVAHRVESSYGS